MNKSYNDPIIVRMDDICPTMNYERFNRFSNMFDELGIRPLLGIVPDNQDPKLNVGVSEGGIGYWELVQQKISQGWDVCMHGVHHKSIGISKGILSEKYGKTEFSGVSLDEQIEVLGRGKRILESHGLEIDTFMPPYHSYDRNTLRALYELDFKYISDGISRFPYVLEGIKHIPAIAAWKVRAFGVLTMCIHSNEESEKSIREIELFLKKNKNRVISFREACGLKTISYNKAYKQEKVFLFYAEKIIPKLSEAVHVIKK